MVNMARYTASQNEFLLSYLQRLRRLGAEQAFVLDDQSGYVGLIVQSHYFHMFSIEPDDYYPWQVGLYNPALEVRDGAVPIPDGPGWGVQPASDWLERASRQVSRL